MYVKSKNIIISENQCLEDGTIMLFGNKWHLCPSDVLSQKNGHLDHITTSLHTLMNGICPSWFVLEFHRKQDC